MTFNRLFGFRLSFFLRKVAKRWDLLLDIVARKNVNDKGGEQLSRTVNGNFGVDRKGIWKDLFFSTCYEDSLGRYLIFLEVLDFQNFLVLENTWSKINWNAYALFTFSSKINKIDYFLIFPKQRNQIYRNERSFDISIILSPSTKRREFLSLFQTRCIVEENLNTLLQYENGTKNLRFSTRLRKKK